MKNMQVAVQLPVELRVYDSDKMVSDDMESSWNSSF